MLREIQQGLGSSGKNVNAGAKRMKMLTGLLRLRQVCCDLRLLSQLSTLNSVKERGSHGALRSQLSTSFTGPLSPDTVFHRAVEGEFDGVLCMYHDQGLIPLKLHAFHEGVNVTLGLPFPRTSPDHGTAFEIAGKGIARADSMIAAIRLAVELATAEAK